VEVDSGRTAADSYSLRIFPARPEFFGLWVGGWCSFCPEYFAHLDFSAFVVQSDSSVNETWQDPSTDRWDLMVSVTDVDDNTTSTLIVYNSTGGYSLRGANLPPDNFAETVEFLTPITSWISQLDSSGPDVLQLLNWIFVSQYSIALFDTGGTAPFIYIHTFNSSYGKVRGDSPLNIFVNQSLFEIYSLYLGDTFLSL
jgi:hypothetical protein